jgi:hypothetical protein
MIDPKTIRETVEALSKLDNIASVLPIVCEQLDSLLDRLAELAESAPPALAALIDIQDSAALAAQNIDKLK